MINPDKLAPTPQHGAIRPTGALSRTLAYILPVALSILTLLIRLLLGLRFDAPPILGLFTFPIMISAYLGGLGPGLVATLLTTLLTNYILMPPYYAFSFDTELNLIETGSLLVAGILISVLSEGLHRERRRAEASRERQAITLASIGDAVITTDMRGQVTFLNAEAERLTGWSSAQAVGQPLAAVFQIVHAHTRAPAEDPVAKVLRSGQVVGLANHTLLVSRDGHETPIDDSGAPIRQTDGTFAGVVLVFRDVAEREQAAAALRASEARFHHTIDSMLEGFQIIGFDWRYRYLNDSAARQGQRPREELIGRTMTECYPGIETTELFRVLQRCMAERTPHRMENQFVYGDGTSAWFDLSIQPGPDGLFVLSADITARKHAEVALRQSEARFETAFHASPAALAITRQSDGYFIDVNASYLNLLGYTRDELIGQRFNAVDIYPSSEQRAELVRLLQTQGSLHSQELTLRAKSGELRQVLFSAEAIELEDQPCFLGIVFDITARKYAEQALRQSETRFAAAFHASAAAMLITRASDGRFLDVNPSYERLFGFARDELIGQTGITRNIYTSPEQRAEIVRLFREQGSLRDLELDLRTKTGELRTVLSSLESIDLDGETCLLGTMVDITGRKRAEQAMERSTDRLRVLADASRTFAEAGVGYETMLANIVRTVAEALGGLCGIRMLSEDGQWLRTVAAHDASANAIPPAQMNLAVAPVAVDAVPPLRQLLLGDRALLLPALDAAQLQATLPPEQRSAVEGINDYIRVVAPLRVSGRPIGLLGVTRARGGRSPFDEDDLRLVQDLADRAALAIGNTQLLAQVQHELAERTKAEGAVRTLNDELEQRVATRTAELSAANKELEAFSYSVSHDLRAPLRAIDGFSRIVLDDFAASLPDDAQEYLTLIRSNAQQMGRLVDDLLAFSRLSRQPITKCPVDTLALVRQCLADLRDERAGRQIDIAIGELPACQGDPALLKQVWINLLANALKYTRQREQAEIVVGTQVEGNETIYFVKDNGAGFDMRYAHKLFGVFQRLHRAEEYEGTGVGLAIVQRIVNRHGGRVWAEAAVDQGATFYFTLGEAERH